MEKIKVTIKEKTIIKEEDLKNLKVGEEIIIADCIKVINKKVFDTHNIYSINVRIAWGDDENNWKVLTCQWEESNIIAIIETLKNAVTYYAIWNTQFEIKE